MLRIVKCHSVWTVVLHVAAVLLVPTALSHLDPHLVILLLFPFLEVIVDPQFSVQEVLDVLL